MNVKDVEALIDASVAVAEHIPKDELPRARHARVIAVRQERKVRDKSDRWATRYITKQDGVLIEYKDDGDRERYAINAPKRGDTDVISARNVFSDWDRYTELLETDRKSKSDVEDVVSRQTVAAAEIINAIGFNSGTHRRGYKDDYVTLTFKGEQIEQLHKALYRDA
jgi:hypothetical protein